MTTCILRPSTLSWLCLAIVLVWCRPATADSIFDDFEDGVIDAGKWIVHEPFGGSSATETGGRLFLDQRPYFATAAEWVPTASNPLTIEFDWMIASSVNNLTVATRSDATWYGAFAELSNGVSIHFSGESDRAVVLRIVSTLADEVPGGGTFPTYHPVSIEPGVAYHIKITDDGSTVLVFFDDMVTPLITATMMTTYATNRVLFHNRELATGADWIDNVTITGTHARDPAPVPEPGSLALAGLALAGFAAWRRREPKA